MEEFPVRGFVSAGNAEYSPKELSGETQLGSPRRFQRIPATLTWMSVCTQKDGAQIKHAHTHTRDDTYLAKHAHAY